MSTHPLPSPGTNLAILVGTISRDPQVRQLPSGDEVLTLELTVRPPEGPAESLPVAWLGAPAAAAGWPAGEEVVVVGRVRRRFYRAAGATQSRTEVVAAVVVPTRRAATAAKAVRAAVAAQL
jgi:single-strand DNA-binding protein